VAGGVETVPHGEDALALGVADAVLDGALSSGGDEVLIVVTR
jgi:hypothetical protein